MPVKVLIIGNGVAGNEAARVIREQDKDAVITILSAEPFPEYDPCSLTYFVGGDIDRQVVFKRAPDYYEQSGINLVLDSPVEAIDTKAQKAVVKGGKEFPYDKLILAHGGSLFIPPIPGVDKKGVCSCKTLGQADDLSKTFGKSAVVIGSGAIGIEAAEALKKKGCEVAIIELLDWIMPTLFDEPASRMLEEALEGYGIKVHTKEKVLEIKGGERVTSVVTDKREIPCDTVVVATGVVPGRALAQDAGIETARGIKVDKHMQTSAPGVYAVGDVAESFDAFTGEPCLYQLKHNAIEQARIAALHILGQDEAYRGSYPFARAHFFDTHSVSFGKTQKTAGDTPVEIVEQNGARGYLRLVLHENKLIGAQAVGRYAEHTGVLMGAMWREDDFRQIREDWQNITKLGSNYPWQYRVLGNLIGMSTVDTPGGLESCFSRRQEVQN
jgi:NADH oxidase (H2O2-forming)